MLMSSANQSHSRSVAAGLLVALSVLATLIPLHFEPQTVFLPEFLATSALFGLLMVIGGRQSALSSRVSAPFLAIAVLIAALAPHLDAGRTLPYFLYLLLACAALLIASATEAEQQGRFGRQIAVVLVATGVGQALCAFLQLGGYSLGGLVLRKIYVLAYGNIGQANHYADLIWLGVAASAFLVATGGLRRWTFGFLAMLLVFAAALSGSRGVWLYTMAFAVLALRLRISAEKDSHRFAFALLWIVVCSVLVQILVAQEAFMSLLHVTAAADRIGDAGSNGQRLHDWQIAWQAMRSHPWLGTGPGSFYSLSAEAAIVGPGRPFPMLAEHAHNLPFHLAAELGLPAAVLFCGALATWFVVQLFKAATPLRYFALCGLSVLGLHSLVEYPLWYTYFLIPAAFFLGLADYDTRRALVVGLPGSFVKIASVVGWICLAWILHDWLTVTHAQRIWAEEARATPEQMRVAIRRELARVPDFSLFGPEARNIEMRTWTPERDTADHMAALCDARWRRLPDWTVMINCADAYAASLQDSKLDQIMSALCRGFPRYHGLLRDWLETSPHLGGLDPTSRACLAEEN